MPESWLISPSARVQAYGIVGGVQDMQLGMRLHDVDT